jgi:predicted ABC-type ATPase
MDLVAGPQGSGKSTFFPVADRGRAAFNVDDHRRRLNRGSARDIPDRIRRRAIADYEAFIEAALRDHRSFSIEVTLAKDVTFLQAKRARELGFLVQLTYIAAGVEQCIARVAGRIALGGHGVPPSVIRDTHVASLRNLPRALREFDVVEVYDGSVQGRLDESLYEAQPRLLLEARRGTVTYVATSVPAWLKGALAETEFGEFIP